MPVITSFIDLGDGVFIGGKQPLLFIHMPQMNDYFFIAQMTGPGLQNIVPVMVAGASKEAKIQSRTLDQKYPG